MCDPIVIGPRAIVHTLFLLMAIEFSPGRGSFVVLSAAEHAGGPRAHRGVSMGPGGAPWRML